ncbi:hypothetical protein OSB04_026533 [Centaurea solstitialis]|uniref:Uncharacterized protein n=1 Tax=Centaurea solstitialis TaxID=347529 RepID=A0AA38SVK8_9ASTR|nr:hypothetical protein OSB04_026533 [Centaurea solstitialis]
MKERLIIDDILSIYHVGQIHLFHIPTKFHLIQIQLIVEYLQHYNNLASHRNFISFLHRCFLMTTTTADVQIFPLCTCIECITNVERALCGIHGVRLLYVNHQNAKFTIETTRDPREIKDALQHMFVGTSVVVSRRINPPSSSVQRPLGFHDVMRELVEGPLGNGLANLEITESTTVRANYATNVHDSEDGGSGYANGAPPPTLLPPLQPRQYQPTTYGSARPYENVGGNGYDYVAPPSQPPPSPPPQQYQPRMRDMVLQCHQVAIAPSFCFCFMEFSYYFLL